MLQLPGGKAMQQELWELGPGLEECKERPSAGIERKVAGAKPVVAL